MKTRSSAIVALLLLVPAPSLGILSVLVFRPGPVGQAIFSAAKIWLLIFPVLWYLGVEKGSFSLSPVREGGLGKGFLIGLGMAALIFLSAWAFGVGHIDGSEIQSRVRDMGIGTPGRFAAGAAYWIFINSIIEEYVFRWFIGHQCETLLGKKTPAALLSAVFFTVHHTIALSTFLSPALVALASLGVFTGGFIWSMLYARHRSIWPGWVAHALADIAVFASGWYFIFGG